MIATALLLRCWQKLHDPRTDLAEDRILRRVCELRAGRDYIVALEVLRDHRFERSTQKVTGEAQILAPWLDVQQV